MNLKNAKIQNRVFRKALIILYLLFLFKVIVLKELGELINSRHFQNYNSSYLKQSVKKANFTPFSTLYYYLSEKEDYHTGSLNIGGNILLFIPLGMLLASASGGLKFGVACFYIMCISTGMELIQLLIAYGTFDVDDILLNIAGGSIGFWLWSYLKAGRLANANKKQE